MARLSPKKPASLPVWAWADLRFRSGMNVWGPCPLTP